MPSRRHSPSAPAPRGTGRAPRCRTTFRAGRARRAPVGRGRAVRRARSRCSGPPASRPEKSTPYTAANSGICIFCYPDCTSRSGVVQCVRVARVRRDRGGATWRKRRTTSGPRRTSSHSPRTRPRSPRRKKVLKKGGFGTVEPTGDGRGWWVVCRGLTDTYQVTVRASEQASNSNASATASVTRTRASTRWRCCCTSSITRSCVRRSRRRRPRPAILKGCSGWYSPTRRTTPPRLVFADFLEENNQPDRAALIRYQVEQARLKPNSKRHKELKALINPLLSESRSRSGRCPWR